MMPSFSNGHRLAWFAKHRAPVSCLRVKVVCTHSHCLIISRPSLTRVSPLQAHFAERYKSFWTGYSVDTLVGVWLQLIELRQLITIVRSCTGLGVVVVELCEVLTLHLTSWVTTNTSRIALEHGTLSCLIKVLLLSNLGLERCNSSRIRNTIGASLNHVLLISATAIAQVLRVDTLFYSHIWTPCNVFPLCR